jgi:Family of unknown function (DUF5995)
MLRRSLVLIVVAVLTAPAPAAAEDPPLIEWSSLLPGLATTFQPSSENLCASGRPGCVDAVVREMQRRFDRRAAACDHDAIFALSYLRTTEEYRRTLAEPDFYEDPRFVTHEDAVFAKLYFDAYDAFHRGDPAATPPAWRIAFDAAADHALPAAGDLFLGINAHVQRDLPFVLAGIGLVKPDGSSRKTDHDRVNRFLNRVTDDLYAEIARRFDPTIDDQGLPTMVDDVLNFQIIPTWREIAWRNAERLVTASTLSERALVAADIEAYAASQAQLLRAASAYPIGTTSAARDAYCAAHNG